MDMTDRQPEPGAVKVYEPGSAQEAPKATPRERGAASPLNFVKNLSISRKLLLISAAFAVPLTIFATIYFVSLQAEVNRALLADHGALFLREAGDLVQAVPQHRGVTNTLRNGNASVAERREALQVRVEEDLAQVLAFEAQYDRELHLADELAALNAAWLEIEENLFTLPANEVFDMHTAWLQNELLPLMVQASNTSTLRTDDDLEVSYLTELVTRDLPALTETLGRMRGYGSGVLAKGFLTSADTLTLETMTGEVSDELRNLNIAFNVLLEEEPEIVEELNLSEAGTLGESALELTDAVLLETGNPDVLSYDSVAYFNEMTGVIDTLFASYTAALDELVLDLDARVADLRQNQLVTAAAVLAALVLILLLVVAIARQITRPVTDLASVAERVGHGDLSQFAQASSRDEIGLLANTFNKAILELREASERNETELARARDLQTNIGSFLDVAMDIADGDFTKRGAVSEDVLGNVVDAINLMVEELTYLLQDVQGAAHSVTEGSSEMAGITDEITQNATLQAEEARKVTGEVQQVTTSIREMAENAEESARAAGRTLQASQQGQQALDNTLHGMQNIRREVQSISKRIKGLGDRSLEISEIVETISRISSQTNLLALNAAIEASGAGEAGSRFAVVAGEVRRLAEDSKLATQRIETLIRAVQNEVQEVIVSVEDGTREVETGYRVTTEAGERLREIGDIANRSAALAQLISQATQGQVRNVEEVGSSVSTIAGISERSQASVVRGREAARKLQELAEAMTGNLARFRLN